jgi:hypothetical protein
MYSLESLEEFSRKDLQKIAKEYGIKANLASAKIIEEILLIDGRNAATTVEEGEQTISEPHVEIKRPSLIPQSDVISQPEVKTSLVQPESIQETALDTRRSMNKSIIASDADSAEADITSDYSIGDKVIAKMNDEWIEVEILRVNKKSVRVMNRKTGWSKSLSFDMLRPPSISSEDTQPMPQPAATLMVVDDTLIISQDLLKEETATPSIVEPKIKSTSVRNSSHSVTNKFVSIRKPSVLKSSSSQITLKPKPSVSSRATITPKLTKAQIARQDAISRKLKGEDPTLARRITPSSTLSKPMQRSASVLPSQRFAQPTASSAHRSSLSGIQPALTMSTSKPSRLAPDFSKAHAKAFERSKSIVDIVHRDEQINKSIDQAYHHSVQFGFDSHIDAKPVQKATSEVVSMTPFKARPMPDFKSQKKVLVPTKTPGKENQENSNRLTASTASSAAKIAHAAARMNKGMVIA